jgi:hypothetical protein
MTRRLKIILWILPIPGIVLGYACAYLSFHGLFETWYFVGKPNENITRMRGISEANKLLVATETGKLYSFEFGRIFYNGFHYEGEAALPPQPAWEKEALDAIDPVHALQYYGADFFSWPPLFQVEQLYQMEYLYRVEGKGEVKFALAADGNIWMWNHQIAGLTGLVFFFYPVIGFLFGAAAALLILGVRWLNGKTGAFQREIRTNSK